MISGGFSRGNPRAHWHSIDTLTNGLMAAQTQPGSLTMAAANQAIYVPVIVRSPSLVTKLWYANDVTATGNYDIGLYDVAGTRILARGSTVKSATDAEITWDCTDTLIVPGVYYMALVSSNGTDGFYAFSPSAPYPTALGVYTESSALPLPATATFGLTQSLGVIPVMGMYLNTLVS